MCNSVQLCNSKSCALHAFPRLPRRSSVCHARVMQRRTSTCREQGGSCSMIQLLQKPKSLMRDDFCELAHLSWGLGEFPEVGRHKLWFGWGADAHDGGAMLAKVSNPKPCYTLKHGNPVAGRTHKIIPNSQNFQSRAKIRRSQSSQCPSGPPMVSRWSPRGPLKPSARWASAATSPECPPKSFKDLLSELGSEQRWFWRGWSAFLEVGRVRFALDGSRTRM